MMLEKVADALERKMAACLDAWMCEQVLHGKAGGPVLQPWAGT
jgi:hypothetical protein